MFRQFLIEPKPLINKRISLAFLTVMLALLFCFGPKPAASTSYCASTDASDPCTYYYGCGSSICLSCYATTDTTHTSYLVVVDDSTTVCGTGGYDPTYEINTCIIDNTYYQFEAYYLAEMYLTEDTLTQSYYCVDKDLYYYDATVTSICGDTQLEIKVANIIEEFLEYVSIGCSNCTVSGYLEHALTDIFYAEQFYIDNSLATDGYAADYLEYGYFYIRTCEASSETNSCVRTEYYNSTYGKCQLCSCKFSYCMYCNQTDCLVYGEDLAYYTDYTNIIQSYCDLDPCETYSKGTYNCESCPTFNCVYTYSTGAYECSYYAYLFVDSTTTVCSYAYTYTNNQRYCYTGNTYYNGEDYYLASYNATAYNITSKVYCMACDIYNNNAATGLNKCSDSCANSAALTAAEYYINGLAIGCGECVSGFDYQQVTQSTFLTSVYLKTCSISTVNSTCGVTEYYDPYNDECVRCACKFMGCAACSYKKCVIQYDDDISTTNCTYSDPCILYENGGTSGNCMQCSDNPVYLYSELYGEYFEYTYKLMLINTTTTICATYGLASTFGDTTTNYLCEVSDKYYKNETFYLLYYYAQGIGQYCIACDLYFMNSTGSNLCADFCYNSGTGLSYLERSVASHSVGCGICAQSDQLMLSVSEVTFIPGLYLSACSSNINDVHCTLTQYYDSTTGTCKTCSDLFPNCAACTSTDCQICADNYYYFTSTTYDYTTSSFLSASQCFFEGCPAGKGIIDATQVCNECGISNCFACNYNSTSLESYCDICDKDYILDPTYYTCSLALTDELDLTYYIMTGGAYLDLTSTLEDYYSSDYGYSPDMPYYFIQQALYDISQLSFYNKKIVATIYVGKGNHFFYFCSAFQQNGNNLTEYCDSTNYADFTLRFLKAKLYTDDITLYVEALECSMADDLQMNSNSMFLSMCVDLDIDDKPTIYVNQPQAYFTLYGDSYFSNLKFSGINQYVRTVVSIYDISTLPLLYCETSTEPTPSDTKIELIAQTITSFPIEFYCFDNWVTFNSIPDSTSSVYACERNSYTKFYDYAESTLSATGEPCSSDFFYEGDSFVEENSGIPPLRRHTLFDIQTFPEYESMTLATPSLTIDNCEFEYFLDSYESLINVDNVQIKNITVVQYYVDDNQDYDSESLQFYVYDGGERGVKLTITDSIFQHSSFSKGLVVYRKQPYIDNEIGFANLTYLYMTDPIAQDIGSFIYLDSSYFYNLNFMTNVTALAIYEGVELKTALYDYTSDTDLEYQVFIHKGIVLNIEDFGGDIEISNCTFLANMHFIPEILITNHSSSITKSVDLFKDASISLEYKMSYCNLLDDTDTFFFQNGIDQSDDLDSYYDDFERLSLIYVSRNRGSIMIRSSNFTQNIGTFGGAISINTMNRQQDVSSAAIAIYDNTFVENMAYFSGNAIYIRMTKSETEYDQICGGGVLIKSNTFDHNIGMKAHNGGAISAVCTYITTAHQDYDYASSESISDTDTVASSEIITSAASGFQFSISKYIFQIYDNSFTENYAGLKGTALYISQISYSQIKSCTFEQNGPVFASFESLYSPYLEYYSNRTITYYDEYKECLTEFAFLANCGSSDSYIDFSHIQGALYVGHCEESYCINVTNTMKLELIDIEFKNNQAGPVLDEYFPSNLASQLFIEGGFSNYIYLVNFNSNDGLYYSLVKSKAQELISYFPPDYFYSQTVPLISVYVDPSADSASSVLAFTTNFTHCQFKDNIHYQVLGLTDTQKYSGSLINYISQYGVVTTNFAPVLRVDNTYFYDNQFIGPSSSLIYANNGIFYFLQNTVSNNGKISTKTFSNPTIDLFDYTPFADYSINNAQQYGVIKIKGNYVFKNSLYHKVYENVFTYSFSEFGSVYNMFLENQYILMTGNVYSYKQYFPIINISKYSFASKEGSILNGLGSVSQSLIKMDSEVINYQFSLNGTLGITSYDSNTMSLILNNTKMYQFYASKASAINLLGAQKIIINNCIFKINSTNFTLDQSVKAGFAQMSHPLNYFIDTPSYNSLVKTATNSSVGSIYIDTVDGSSQNDYAGILTQDSTDEYESYVEVYNTLFQNLYATAASVFYVSASNIIYKNDANNGKGIFNCSHYKSGAIYINNGGIFEGENLLFMGMTSGSTASVLYVSQESSAQLTNSYFTNNYASGKGLIIVDGSSSLTLSACSFVSNYAYDSSIIFADNNPSGQISIDGSQFENNTSSSNLFYLIFTTSTISNSNFINNIAQIVNHGITITNSYLTLNNVSIHYTDESFLSSTDTKVETGFLNINFESNVFILNSLISNTRGKTSGFLYATGQSNLTIDSNTIFQNCYSKLGSILYMSSTDQVSISNSQFINNTLQDISINNGNATLSKNLFSKGDQQFIYATSSSLEVIENTFQNGQNTGINGKAIFCNCLNLTVIKSVFNNLASVQGGALYLTSSSVSSVFFVHNNTFSNNEAQQGGAIFIQDGPYISVENNTFIANSANVISPSTKPSALITQKGQGGAIYYDCLNTDLNLDGNCVVKIQKKNRFIQNSAQNDGGAIIWVTNNFVDDDTNEYDSNTANYGDDIASYPQELILTFLSNGDYYNPITNSRRLSESIIKNRMLSSDGFSSLVSGTTFQFIATILDQQGNVYTADSSSVATVSSSSTSTDVLFKYNVITAQKGVYDFTNLVAYTTPGTSFSLSMDISGLTTYGNSISFIDEPLSIQVSFRNCVQGEELTSSLACVACANGTYSYFAPDTYSSCSDCSTSANCYGKNITTPKAGYWRANASTDSWVTCPRAASCLGGNMSYPTGECASGYNGTACASCIDNYSYSNYECTECPNDTKNAIICAAILSFICFYSGFLVRSTIISANKKKPIYSVYIKILTNHFQIIGAISSIDYSWPTEIETFQNSQVKTSSVSTQLFNFDCLLFKWSITDSVGTYYEKLILYAISPLIFTLLATLFWLIICCVRRSFKSFKDHIISTIVILLFLLHPSITTAMFSAFNCIELDGIYYLKGDMASICYQGKHTFYIYIVILPSIIIWIIGIPLMALFCLMKNRVTLKKSLVPAEELSPEEQEALFRVKLKYGFLFTGYQGQYYYWEIIILYRKIFLIMSTVFLSVVSPESQVLVAMMIVLVNMIAHTFNTPFYTHQLNQMELYSLQVATITMYCGLFYITGQHYTYMNNDILKWFFLVFLVVPNIIFFGYWIIFMHLEFAKYVVVKSILGFRIITCRIFEVERFKERFMQATISPTKKRLYGVDEKEDIKDKVKRVKKEVKELQKQGITLWSNKKVDASVKSNSEIEQTNGLNCLEENSQLIIGPDEVKLAFTVRSKPWKKDNDPNYKQVKKRRAPEKYEYNFESDSNTIKYDSERRMMENEQELKLRQDPSLHTKRIQMLFKQKTENNIIEVEDVDPNDEEVSLRRRAKRFLLQQMELEDREETKSQAIQNQKKRAQRCLQQNSKSEDELDDYITSKQRNKAKRTKRYNPSEDQDLLNFAATPRQQLKSQSSQQIAKSVITDRYADDDEDIDERIQPKPLQVRLQ